MASTLVIGFGLGFLAMPCLIAVQNAVPWQRRGVATSTVQFFRTIGGTVAVAALGALLNARLAGALAAGHGRPAGPVLDTNAALDPALRARLAPAALAALTAGLASGLQGVFAAIAIAAVAGLGMALLFPPGLPRRRPAATVPAAPGDTGND